MNTTVVAALALAFVVPAAPAYAAFTGHYAIPMNGPVPSYTTTSSVPVGNWTLSSAMPTTVAELYRSPNVASLDAEGVALFSFGGEPVKLSVTVPQHGALECLVALQWLANLQPGGAVWLRDGNGLQLLTDSFGPLIGYTWLLLVPGEPLELIVSGAPQAVLQLMAVTPLPALANAEAKPASAVAATTVTLNGRVFYWELPTQMWFEWGWADYSHRAEASTAYATSCGADIQAELTGLFPDATYRFRVAASNEAGIVRSAPMEFTTARRPGPVRLGLAANGTRLLDYEGTPAALYLVWGSTDLTHWQRLGQGSEIATGHFRFADDTAPGPSWRFYRVSSP